jgi:putative nucleotidyltransferase with HDIG domain
MSLNDWSFYMRLVATSSVQPGAILAKAIVNDKGIVLVSDGVPLTEKLIARLTDLGVTYIYVKDPRTDDIKSGSSIDAAMKRKAVSVIEDTFTQLKKGNKLSDSIIIEKSSKSFQQIIRDLLKQINDNKDLIGILTEVCTYDDYIFSHSLNVTLYSLAIGIELKLKPKELDMLGIGAILHDVGKMKVPAEILLKNGKLTEEEFTEVQKHAEAGFNILRSVHTVPLLAAHCAYQHHERLNGSGYPRQLVEDEIHLFAKIIAVADVFDAVTSNRVYRGAMLPHEGLEILYAGSGKQFDTAVVEAFRRSVAVYPSGMMVYLNDGRSGVVVRQNKGVSDRPVVRILEDNGLPVEPFDLDLAEELTVIIAGCEMRMPESVNKN